jgi:uncharacterized protein YndB with AHSA1/START domain
MSTAVTDRIEKQIVLRAARPRVWKALTDSGEFGAWFGVVLEQAFAPGATVRGRITHPGYEHLMMEVVVERVEPERYLSFRWHPYAHDPAVDYSSEPMTLVEFTLEDRGKDTVLTVVESGFDRVPVARRAEAFRMNSDGWAQQVRNIERHVTQA